MYCTHSLSLVLTALAVGAASAGAGVALIPVLVPVGLGVIGFSAAGPVAGEFPAWPTSRPSIPLPTRENWNF